MPSVQANGFAMKARRFRKAYPPAVLTVLLTMSPVVPNPADAQEARPGSPACAMPSTYASRWACDNANLPSRFNRFEDPVRQVQRENPMPVMLEREGNWVALTLRPETVPELQPDVMVWRDTVAALAAHPHRTDLEKGCVTLAPLPPQSLALTCPGTAPEGSGWSVSSGGLPFPSNLSGRAARPGAGSGHRDRSARLHRPPQGRQGPNQRPIQRRRSTRGLCPKC